MTVHNSHSQPNDSRPFRDDWKTEAQRLGESLHESPEPLHAEPLHAEQLRAEQLRAEQLRADIHTNLRVLSQLRPTPAPDHLWQRIAAKLTEPSEVTPGEAATCEVTRLTEQRQPRRTWRLVLATGAAVAAMLLLTVGLRNWAESLGSPHGGSASDTPNPTPPIAVQPSPVTPTATPIATRAVPTETELLARMATAAEQPYSGVLVAESFAPEDPRVLPTRRETQLVVPAPDRWEARTAETVQIRLGEWKFVALDSAKPGQAIRFTQVRAEDTTRGGRSPTEWLPLDAARLAANYRLTVADGGPVAGRETWLLTAEPSQPNRPRIRLRLDRETGARLAGEKLDATGRTLARWEFQQWSPTAGEVSAPVSRGSVAGDSHSEFRPDRDQARLGFVPRHVPAAARPAGLAEVRSVLINQAAAGRVSLRTTFTDGLARVELYQRQADASEITAKAPGDAPTAQRRGRTLEAAAMLDGVVVRLVSEDLAADELLTMLRGVSSAGP